MCQSKIIATIGPASDSKVNLEKLYRAGLRIARLNFSHGTHEYFDTLIKRIRSISDKIAIIIDTKGPEIRTARNQKDIFYDTGKIVKIVNKGDNDKDTIMMDYKHLSKLKKGDHMLIDDGYLEAKILERENGVLKAKIIVGNILSSSKTVVIRNHYLNAPFISKKDREDILFAIKQNLDFVAASFVRDEEDVITLRKFLDKYKSNMKIISKIEHSKAIGRIDEIIRESDGIMVARGDLGVEVEAKKVPRIQKEIIQKCNLQGKPVIVATQMLESMKNSQNPTRAEVTDVAQAIMEGVDAVMLSGETASGKYPLQAFKMMKSIVDEYSKDVNDDFIFTNTKNEKKISINIGRAAANLGRIIGVNAIITPTSSGFSARNVARFKPDIPIYAITHNKTVQRQLQLSRGVTPLFHSEVHKPKEFTSLLTTNHYGEKVLKKTDTIIITSGRLGVSGKTNTLEIHRVKDLI